MKISECHLCEHYEVDSVNRQDRCLLASKTLIALQSCPKTEAVKPWTHEERDRLMRLIGSGTHLRNIALIMGRTYTDIEEKMKLEYVPPSDDERTCENCGRSGYCRKQYYDGCDYSQWIALTPRQIKDRILMETRRNGLHFNY